MNPLMKLSTPNRGKKPTDRPEPVAPLIEERAGDVFLYRGTEQHGVTPTGGTEDPDGWDGTVDAYYEVADEGPEPIPVRVVQKSAHELVKYQTQQFAVSGAMSGQTARLLGRDPSRRKWRLFMPYASYVYVGDRDVKNFSGMILFNGVSLEGTSTDELWAFFGDGAGGGIAAGTIVYVSTERAFIVD